MAIQMYFARHASPDWTRKDIRYDIPPGPSLTAKGESEAKALGEYLSALSIKKVYASPLERAHQTALLCGEVLGLVPVVDHAIAEWTRDETVELVAKRMVPFWQLLCEECERIGPICVVTHGGPLGYILHHMGLSRDVLKGFREQYSDQAAPPAGLWSATSESTEGPWNLELVFTP